MISPDDQALYFIADYPPDIWKSRRLENQDWSAPAKLDLSTPKDDWYVTFSKINTLYFTNGAVFKSTLKNGVYQTKEQLQIKHFSEDIRDACISPDEDYLIFTAARSLANTKSDLFITFKDGKGNWSEPQNLGEGINTEYIEFAPYISPDGKFLFFSRRDSWENAEFSNIYWVGLEVIPLKNP